MTATPFCAVRRRSRMVFALLALVAPRLYSAEPLMAPEKPKPVAEWKYQGVLAPASEPVPDESKAYKSLDVGSLSPLAEQLGKLGLYSGFYDFNEGVEDKVIGVRKREEVSFANKAFIQSEYHTDPEVRRENGFVGFWASFPLRTPGESKGEHLERLRTRREPHATGPAQEMKTPAAQVASQLQSMLQVSKLFKSKPKSNLIPTGGRPPGTAAEMAANFPPSDSPAGSASQASSGPPVAAKPEAGAATDSEAVPAVEKKTRFLGLIPVSASSASTGNAPVKRVGLAEKLFGKINSPPRRSHSTPGSRGNR